MVAVTSHRHNDYVLVSIPVRTDSYFMGSLHFWFSDDNIVSKAREAVLVSACIFVLSVVTGSLLAWRISSAITKPLNVLAFDSKLLSSGNLDHEVCSPCTVDEVGLLANNFRLMRDSIKEKMEQLQNRNRELANEIVERKKIADKLQVRETQFRDLAELLPLVIFELDADNNLSYTNRHGFESMGYSPKDIEAGLNVSSFIHPDDLTRAIANMKKKMAGDKMTVSQEYRFLRKDGTTFPCLIYSAPILKDDLICGMRGIIVDISERKKLEDQLRQSQKMEAVGQLAGGIAHDFNNMLAGILGAAELLALHIDNNPKMEKLQNIIQNSAERAAELTRNLLTFARKNPSVSSPINAHKVIEKVTDLLESTIDRQITIELDLAAANNCVIGDSAQLQNCFLNIGINAAQAMPRGGKIAISSKVVDLDSTYCNASPFRLIPGSYLDIEIVDTGDGIPAQDLEKIFEPFFTTKEHGKGTGLGLASVYGCIQQHKGTITVHSKVGRGTSFHILLPLVKDVTESITKKVDLVYGTGRILVVDDEEAMRFTMQTMLEQLGYEVVLASNGQEGLVLFQTEPNAFDLVILDMIMPEMSGRECFFAIKKLKPGVRILLSSGFTQEEDLVEMQKSGLSGFIAKPFRATVFSRTVHDALNSSSEVNSTVS